jgi:hypothetical protein
MNVSVPPLFDDTDGDAVTYSVWDGSLAPWLSIVNSEDRRARWLVGTPDRNSHKALSVSIVGRDGRGGVSGAVAVVVMIANSAPTAVGSGIGNSSSGLAPQSVSVGSVAIVAIPSGMFSDVDGDALTYGVSRVGGSGSGSVGSFVSVSGSSVVISPRAGAQGSYVVQLSAFDGQGGSASSVFTVDVPNAAPVLAYSIPAPPAAMAGTPWVYTLEVGVFVDPDGDALTLTSRHLSDGSPLPSWLQFDGRRRAWFGTATGTSRGVVTVVVSASDRFGGAVTANVTITVVNAAPVYVGRVYDQQTSQDASGPLSFTVPGFEDPDGDPVLLSAVQAGKTALPSWVQFDASSARFSVHGTRAPPGSYFLTVTGTDPGGINSSVTFKLDVQARAVIPSGKSQTLQQLAQYGAPVLLSSVLVLLSGAAVAWRHRRVQSTSARVRAWSARVLREASVTSGGLAGATEFLAMQRLHARFYDSVCHQVACADLCEALEPFQVAAMQLYGGPSAAQQALVTALPVKAMCRALLNSIRGSLFEAVGAAGANAGGLPPTCLDAARVLHRYLRILLAVHASRGCKLSPALKQTLFRYVGAWVQ